MLFKQEISLVYILILNGKQIILFHSDFLSYHDIATLDAVKLTQLLYRGVITFGDFAERVAAFNSNMLGGLALCFLFITFLSRFAGTIFFPTVVASL